ncbi:DUF397 domain-containing protein [Actinoallomurus sp. NPDC052274]
MGLITDWRKSQRSAQNGGACVEVTTLWRAVEERWV